MPRHAAAHSRPAAAAGLDARRRVWFSTDVNRALLLMVAIATTLSACAGGLNRAPSPVATTVTSPAAPAHVMLGNETFSGVRTLPPSALSAEQLEAVGTATGADGERIQMARADTPDAAPWELVSATADGWRVWRPQAVLDVMAAAGASATLTAVERVSWPDTCLGLPRTGELCAQVVTLGYRITLQRDGQRIEYHTSLTGGARLAPSP